ncbi:IS701 family transposase [Methanocaldococcus sp. 28A]
MLKMSRTIVYMLFILLSEINSCVELSKTLRIFGIDISHDTINRILWEEGIFPQEKLFNFVKDLITPDYNIVVIDDFVIDKIYSKSTEFAYYCWSNLHKRVIKGIHIVDCIITNGKHIIPIDFRVYDRPRDGKTKNNLCREIIKSLVDKGLNIRYICFDSWYSSKDNLKLIDSLGLFYLCRIKRNRKVKLSKNGKWVSIEDLKEIPKNGLIVYLRKVGYVRLFCLSKNGKAKYYITNNLFMSFEEFQEVKNASWRIEEFHRGVKQCCNTGNFFVRKKFPILGHISLSMRAFYLLEKIRIDKNISWYELRRKLNRIAVGNAIISLCEEIGLSLI